jgi:DNA-binding response OmpR family regulator
MGRLVLQCLIACIVEAADLKAVGRRYELGMSDLALVIDDEESLRSTISRLLERSGIEVVVADGGEAGLRALFERRPSLVMLDIQMPGIDGWAVLERIRAMTDVPVIVVSSLSGELEKVRALNAGADDFIVKPFGSQELVARAHASLRRGRRADLTTDAYEDDLMRIDFSNASVVARGCDVTLTPLELRMLAAFVRHPNQVLSASQLLDLVWAADDLPEQRVKIYVGYLRRRFREMAEIELPIETVRGFGYRFRPPT